LYGLIIDLPESSVNIPGKIYVKIKKSKKKKYYFCVRENGRGIPQSDMLITKTIWETI